MSENEEEGPRGRLELVVPWATIGKLLVAALLVWVFLKLWLPFLVFLVAVLIAVTLHPGVAWLERRNVSHGLAVAVVAVVMLAVRLRFPPHARLTRH